MVKRTRRVAFDIAPPADEPKCEHAVETLDKCVWLRTAARYASVYYGNGGLKKMHSVNGAMREQVFPKEYFRCAVMGCLAYYTAHHLPEGVHHFLAGSHSHGYSAFQFLRARRRKPITDIVLPPFRRHAAADDEHDLRKRRRAPEPVMIYHASAPVTSDTINVEPAPAPEPPVQDVGDMTIAINAFLEDFSEWNRTYTASAEVALGDLRVEWQFAPNRGGVLCGITNLPCAELQWLDSPPPSSQGLHYSGLP